MFVRIVVALVIRFRRRDVHQNELCFEGAGEVGGNLHYRIGHVGEVNECQDAFHERLRCMLA